MMKKDKRSTRLLGIAGAVILALLLSYNLFAQPTSIDDKIAMLITGWGMSSNYNFEYAWRSHDYPRIGDRTEYEGQPCKIGHIGEFPYESHINFIPFSILFEMEGRELLFDSYGVYEYDSVNNLYVSSCPDADAPSLSPDQIPEDIPIVPMGEVVSTSTGELSYPPDSRTGEDHLAGWFKIGNFNNPYPNGCQDLKDEGPITYIRIFSMLAGEMNKPDEYIPDPYGKAQDEHCELLLEEAFGDRIDVRYGYYTSAPPHTKHMTEVAQEFADEGYAKMLLARETTDHNRYANEFMTGNYVKEALCEIDKLDDMTIFQTRQIGRTPEFHTMNIRNLKPLIESYPEGSTIGMVYVTRGLTWGKDETPGWFGTAHPWSKEVYHENAYLNYLAWKKALQKAFGARYDLVFTREGKNSDLREDNFYSYGLGNDIDLKGYGGETVFYGIREVIEWAVADGLDKLIVAPCHWSSDSLDPVYRMKELNNLVIAPKEDLVAGNFVVVHCEDVAGSHVSCDDSEAAVEITAAGSYSHLPEEFGTSYYVVLRGTLEQFGLYPQDELFWDGASKEINKLSGGTVRVSKLFSFINRAQIDIPADPYPDRPEGFTYETAIAIDDPTDTNDCMWNDTTITIKHRRNPPPMNDTKAVGPAVHYGPYRTFFNRDVTITIPYWRLFALGQEVTAHIYNHVTEDWDELEVESVERGLVTFKTQVLGLFQVGIKQ